MSRTFILQSSDGNSFILEGKAALKSQMIKDMIEDDCPDEVIPVPFAGNILAKVVDYCKKHAETPLNSGDDQIKEELRSWDAEFLKVDQYTLFDLVLAAKHLNVDDLLNETVQAVYDMIHGMTADEIRKVFQIDSSESSGCVAESGERCARDHTCIVNVERRMKARHEAPPQQQQLGPAVVNDQPDVLQEHPEEMELVLPSDHSEETEQDE